MIRLTLFLVLSVTSLSAMRAMAGLSAEGLASAYCSAVQQADEAAAELLMTADLRARIEALRTADAEFRAEYPGDKPPLGDGLRLTAFPDGLASCTPVAVAGGSVDLVYAPGSDPASVWRDRLVLSPAPGGGVLIADILFAPDLTGRFSDWLSDSASWK